MADSSRLGLINYDVDVVHQVQADSQPPLPPPGEPTLVSIKRAYPQLFEGLGELGPPLSLALDPNVKPIQAAPHRFSALKLPIIKETLDKLIHSGQLVRINDPTPWI